MKRPKEATHLAEFKTRKAFYSENLERMWMDSQERWGSIPAEKHILESIGWKFTPLKPIVLENK